MDSLCQHVNRIINIDPEREKYTKMYDCVRNAIINGLREYKHFNTLYSGLKLCGSYADNLKISKPDEFDLVVCLKFPHNECVEIIRDNEHRGNVFINISKVLDRLEKDKNEDTRKFLEGMINSKKYFLQDKFQNWVQGCVVKFLIKINYQITQADGSVLQLFYRRQGPAHTIEVSDSSHEFSIDFVPGFLFEASKSITKRKVTSTYWQAIPKPMGVKDNKSFRTSYTESEREIFANKNQFKNTLRMMKKFRDNKPKMVNLKSYHLKTLFLWHDEKCDPNFWSKSNLVLIHEMFDVLQKALANQFIPFFWDKDHNLLDRFSETQIQSMYHEVAAAKKILMQPRGYFASIFLTKEEQIEYNKQKDSEDVIDSGTAMDELCQKISRVINNNSEVASFVNGRLDFVKNKLIKSLQENKDFCQLLHEVKPLGCHADKCNVSKANAFNFLIGLRLPHNDCVEISRDNEHWGNVFIKISKVLDRLEEQKKDDTRKFLEGMVNSKKYLLQDKFQNWIEARFDSILRNINRQLTYTDGSILYLRYQKHGAAHKINVTNSSCEFSIDFVPGFLFEASKSITKRKVTSTYWQAIPKPMGVKDNKSFTTSYMESERKIFANKNQFKNTLRMMKKFRDNKPKMVNLKNYHLKTIFLWHDEVSADNFWSKPTIEILHVMFKKLDDALERNEIPYFWEKKLNLLGRLKCSQIESMYIEVRRAKYVLLHAENENDFLRLFLNDEEISQVNSSPQSLQKAESEIEEKEEKKEKKDDDEEQEQQQQQREFSIRQRQRQRQQLQFHPQPQQQLLQNQEESGIMNSGLAKLGLLATVGAAVGFLIYKSMNRRND